MAYVLLPPDGRRGADAEVRRRGARGAGDDVNTTERRLAAVRHRDARGRDAAAWRRTAARAEEHVVLLQGRGEGGWLGEGGGVYVVGWGRLTVLELNSHPC